MGAVAQEQKTDSLTLLRIAKLVQRCQMAVAQGSGSVWILSERVASATSDLEVWIASMSARKVDAYQDDEADDNPSRYFRKRLRRLTLASLVNIED